MLFYQPHRCPDNVGDVDWLEELDLKRALRRLDSVYSIPNVESETAGNMAIQGVRGTPLAAASTTDSIYGILQQQGPVPPSLWEPLETSAITQAMTMHGGPIPGFDAGKLYAEISAGGGITSTPERLTTTGTGSSGLHGLTIAAKRRVHSHDSQSASPASSERSATASPSSVTGTGPKKPKSHSIVHSTYYASR